MAVFQTTHNDVTNLMMYKNIFRPNKHKVKLRITRVEEETKEFKLKLFSIKMVKRLKGTNFPEFYKKLSSLKIWHG